LQTQNNFFLLYLLILICCFSCTKTNSFQLKSGDLLFQDLDSSPLCDAIEKVTSGFNNLNFSHVGIVIIINEENYVLEAFVNGVDTIPIHNFLNRSLNQNNNPKVIVGRLKDQYSHLIPKAIQLGIDLIGTDYDEEFKINNNKLYCSELIYDIFLKANNQQKVFSLNPMTYQHNGKTLDIWIDYFNVLGITIPENEPGINPGSISLSKKINIIHNYYH